MPHVAFAAFTGLRVRDQEMLELGMALPGLRTGSLSMLSPKHFLLNVSGAAMRRLVMPLPTPALRRRRVPGRFQGWQRVWVPNADPGGDRVRCFCHAAP